MLLRDIQKLFTCELSIYNSEVCECLKLQPECRIKVVLAFTDEPHFYVAYDTSDEPPRSRAPMAWFDNQLSTWPLDSDVAPRQDILEWLTTYRLFPAT